MSGQIAGVTDRIGPLCRPACTELQVHGRDEAYSRSFRNGPNREAAVTKLRVAICGVAGHNRGDDAIALALAEGILAQASNARIAVAVLTPVNIARPPAIRTFLCARSKPAG